MSDLELITVTADNILWAVNENFERIFAALAYKVPMNGAARLQGDWDFQGANTIRGIISTVPGSALPVSEA